ncbi:hypothetical protein EDC27_3112 [Desulfosoma caldarium]|uniref:Polyketide cyclase/dehydrase/lipid transport protein n=1 Tax=Desulfosoma caldarium TaxID=610254 RepID=A0A3N1UDU1_9BACT|nr:hypothetical protein EDC27_3112 [Desulfosoma caldarium]
MQRFSYRDVRLRFVRGRLWIGLRVQESAEVLWRIFTDTRWWPLWGPSVRRVQVRGSTVVVHQGLRGRVWTVLGFSVPFFVDQVGPGYFWSWRVGGIRATGHEVRPEGSGASWLAFTVPVWGIFYLPVCVRAATNVARLARLLSSHASDHEDPAPINGNSFSTEKKTANSLAPGSSERVG